MYQPELHMNTFNRHPRSHFVPLGVDEELALLKRDVPTFTETAMYVAPLVALAVTRLSLGPRERQSLTRDLLGEVPIAASRFLRHYTPGREYRFAVYFTWYISQRLRAQEQ